MFDKLLPLLCVIVTFCDVCLFLLHFLAFINSFCFSACLCFVFYSSFGYLILKCMLQPVSPSDPCSAVAVMCMMTEWRECGHQAFCSPHSRGVTLRTPTFDLFVILISIANQVMVFLCCLQLFYIATAISGSIYIAVILEPHSDVRYLYIIAHSNLHLDILFLLGFSNVSEQGPNSDAYAVESNKLESNRISKCKLEQCGSFSCF
jgi:hypothetical protein